MSDVDAAAEVAVEDTSSSTDNAVLPITIDAVPSTTQAASASTVDMPSAAAPRVSMMTSSLSPPGTTASNVHRPSSATSSVRSRELAEIEAISHEVPSDIISARRTKTPNGAFITAIPQQPTDATADATAVAVAPRASISIAKTSPKRASIVVTNALPKPASTSTPRLRFELNKSRIDYRYDADHTMQTEAMLAQRRALKADQGILKWIFVFWRTFPRQNMEEHDPMSGCIDRQQYMIVHKLWFKALHKIYERADAHAQAIKDWSRDSWLSSVASGSMPLLDYRAFIDAVFELVDIWTLTVEATEYIHFLATLYHRVTKVKTWLADDGTILSKYVWRKTKYVKPSAVYRPYQYAKYKDVKWKEAVQVLHHLESDSDSDEDSDDQVDDAILHDLAELSDDSDQILSDDEDDDDDDDDGDETQEPSRAPTAERHSNKRESRVSRISVNVGHDADIAAISHNEEKEDRFDDIDEEESFTLSRSRTASLRGSVLTTSTAEVLGFPLLPSPKSIMNEAEKIARSLPAPPLSPPLSPFLDPPAVIPKTPAHQSRPQSQMNYEDSGDDSDEDDETKEELVSDNEMDMDHLMKTKEAKVKSTLTSAIDVLAQRKQERYEQIVQQVASMINKKVRKLRRSNSAVLFTSKGVPTVDVDRALLNDNQQIKYDDDTMKRFMIGPLFPPTQKSKAALSVNKLLHARKRLDRPSTAPSNLAIFTCLPAMIRFREAEPSIINIERRASVPRPTPIVAADDEKLITSSRRRRNRKLKRMRLLPTKRQRIAAKKKAWIRLI